MDAQSATPEKRKPQRWERAFLSALSLSANVSAACRAAKIERRRAYELRGDAPDFASAWQDAIEQAADALEAEATRRARDGVDEPVIYQGELCGVWVDAAGQVVPETTEGARKVPLTIKRYSDTLLIFLLKAHRPGRFRENVLHEHTGEVVVKVIGVSSEAL